MKYKGKLENVSPPCSMRNDCPPVIYNVLALRSDGQLHDDFPVVVTEFPLAAHELPASNQLLTSFLLTCLGFPRVDCDFSTSPLPYRTSACSFLLLHVR